MASKAKAVAKAAEEDTLSPTTRAAIKAAKEADAAELAAPTLRRSTMQRVEEAEKERQEAEKLVSLAQVSTSIQICLPQRACQICLLRFASATSWDDTRTRVRLQLTIAA